MCDRNDILGDDILRLQVSTVARKIARTIIIESQPSKRGQEVSCLLVTYQEELIAVLGADTGVEVGTNQILECATLELPVIDAR